MDGGWIDPFFQHYGLIGLGADLFLEAMGAPVPGESLLIASAGMAAAGVFDIRAVVLVAVLAAALGDNLGYLIGRRFGRPVVLAKGARIGITEARLARVEAALDHRGVVVVTFARFFPILRQLNGLAAGTAGMHWARFLVANSVGAVLWAGGWSWAVYSLGAHDGLLPALWAHLHRIAWVLVPVWILVYLLGWLWLRRNRAG